MKVRDLVNILINNYDFEAEVMIAPSSSLTEEKDWSAEPKSLLDTINFYIDAASKPIVVLGFKE